MSLSGDIRSILAADIGSAWTKVVLIDWVEGQFRLVARAQAPTTLGGSGADGIMSGLRAAIAQIERTIGRQLLRGDNLLMPEAGPAIGVDAFAATTSAAENLAVVIAGLCRDTSVRAAQAAASATYCDVRAVVSANGGVEAGSDRRWFALGTGDTAGALEDLAVCDADAVLLVGGYDGGAVGPVRDLATAVASAGLTRIRDRSVVFAGNVAARASVTELLAGETDLRVVDNVAPRPGVMSPEPTARELGTLYRERKLKQLAGYHGLISWSVSDVLPSADCFWLTLRFLAQEYRSRLLGVDVGSANTVLGVAYGDTLERTIRTRMGTGSGCRGLLASVGSQRVARWLKDALTEEEILAFAQAREDQPFVISASDRQIALEAAFAREAMRAVTGPRQVDMVLGSGGSLARSLTMDQAALALLDGVQPVGVVELALDPGQLAAVIGAVASRQPDAAAQVVLGDSLVHLGLAVCPTGQARPGHVALRARLRLPDGVVAEREVTVGSIARMAAPPGARAQLEIRPSRGFSVGLGSGVPAVMELVCSGLGVLIDCRGRPFEPPADASERAVVLQQWSRAMASDGEPI
jgi:hypothetical protein